MSHYHELTKEHEKRVNRTYLIDREIVGRIDQVSERFSITKADLVSNLLKYSLDALEAGEIKVTTRTPRLRYVDAIRPA